MPARAPNLAKEQGEDRLLKRLRVLLDIVDTSDKNLKRGLVTKKGLTLAFIDDDKAQLYLQTPGGSKVLLDDDGELVALSDKHGNKLILDKDGVTITSAKNFKVDAKGNVEIKGSKVDLK